jgi:glycosyltransferase involved in cell wall biosynthesis
VRRVTLKIAHFSWEFPPVIYGGLGTFAAEITQKQEYFGNEVTVFSLNQDNKYKTYEKWNGINIYRPKILDLTQTFNLFAAHELRSWGTNLKFFADVVSYNTTSASQMVNNLVKKENKTFDIIDAHDWLGIIGGMVIKKELNIPLVFHVHSTEHGRSIGDGSHTIKNIEYDGGQVADRVITVSYAMKEELEKLGFPSENIRVCWNGVDPNKYDPNKISEEEKKQLRRMYGISDNENMLFFIGRLVTVKGVYNLVKAIPSILEDFPNSKLVILGIGDLESELKSISNELNIQDKIIFRTEFIDEKDRILHYAASDCVILPSTYEPFGIVCTESMSMEKPTVVGATGTNGFREQIVPEGDEKCGIHINPHDPNDIAWGVKEILKLEDKGKQIGKNARKRVLDLFSWEAVTKRTIDIYKELV